MIDLINNKAKIKEIAYDNRVFRQDKNQNAL